MGANSKIEWTNATCNPIKARRKDNGKVGWHCEKCSPACKFCYACTFNKRNLPNGGTGLEYSAKHRSEIDIFLDVDVLKQPLQWKKPRRIFMCSMTDLFGEFVPEDLIAEVWKMFAVCNRTGRGHTFQVLTKRADRMAELMPRLVATFGVLQNVHLGVTVENQLYADLRIPELLQCEAGALYVSYEPALGPINFRRINEAAGGWTDALSGQYYLIGETVPPYAPARVEIALDNPRPRRLSQIIAGGESGSQARPPHPDWFRSARDQCVAAGVPYFFKQWGTWKPISEMAESEHSKYYVSNRHSEDPAKQAFYDESYGKRSIVPVGVVRYDGIHGDAIRGPAWEVIDGHSAYSTFKLGKKKSGRLLDGREWSEFPRVAQ